MLQKSDIFQTVNLSPTGFARWTSHNAECSYYNPEGDAINPG
jgi:hypothetical protein